MKGFEIIQKLGMDQTHDFVGGEIFKIDPEYDYVIVKGTEDNPKVVCQEHEKAVLKGRYPRLKIEGKELLTDVSWIAGHHAFEGKVEPRFTAKR